MDLFFATIVMATCQNSWPMPWHLLNCNDLLSSPARSRGKRTSRVSLVEGNGNRVKHHLKSISRCSMALSAPLPCPLPAGEGANVFDEDQGLGHRLASMLTTPTGETCTIGDICTIVAQHDRDLRILAKDRRAVRRPCRPTANACRRFGRTRSPARYDPRHDHALVFRRQRAVRRDGPRHIPPNSKDLRYRRGEGIIGTVFQTGEAAIIPRSHRNRVSPIASTTAEPRPGRRQLSLRPHPPGERSGGDACRSTCRCRIPSRLRSVRGCWGSSPA